MHVHMTCKLNFEKENYVLTLPLVIFILQFDNIRMNVIHFKDNF